MFERVHPKGKKGKGEGEKEKEKNRGERAGSVFGIVAVRGWKEDSTAARATTRLLCRLVPDLAPLVAHDRQGSGDDGT
jgi:hypothetical protein